MNLLTVNNPKTLKGEKKGYLSFILHLSPSRLSGYNVCPMATKGCAAACLNTAGMGGMFKGGSKLYDAKAQWELIRIGALRNDIQNARIRKTKMLFEDRAAFLAMLERDIRAGIKRAAKRGMIPCFRLNGTSDYRWETTGIMEKFPDTIFYDYRKVERWSDLPNNYHLTFSRSETNDAACDRALSEGVNVAVVFNRLPNTWRGYQVINGDESDLRFLDPKGVIVGLKWKGRAKKDASGFVVHV